MGKDPTTFEHPLAGRYASEEMRRLFSDQRRFETWRAIWIALAECERDLGVRRITGEALAQMRAHATDLNLDVAQAREREVRHDVMAHVFAFGQQAPDARGIIHLGATSCDITDNADLILLRQGLALVRDKLLNLLDHLARFAARHAARPTLAFTHFQPAQPTTVGKRATLWAHDFLIDFQEIDRWIDRLPFRGVKGATGTQASFLALFMEEGCAKAEAHARVEALDAAVRARFGFPASVPVSGQTYSRKFDTLALGAVAGVGESAHKFGADLRLLAHMREIEEPFEPDQVGSSAMAYKRNPMRAERMCSLARHLFNTAQNARLTHATQWLERTLDDSANRRMTIPEVFLGADAVLNLALNVAAGLVVHPRRIDLNLRAELPFMATEDLLMAAVAAGGDRQALHERLRQHSMEATRRVTDEGAPNDLLDRVARDDAFAPVRDRLPELADPRRFIGRAPEQVAAFIAQHIDPLRQKHRDLLGRVAEVNV
ncbi:MAG: adenylosuccinate lyase [Planctomycetes bacterium]|nr:adenylosuccinate lyase [Planctomycetota bacterium]